ncbi:MAG: ATP-dependent DNA helicase RecG [Gammaproteobacteria bacterium]|nr:ATP-dependent DNA helicase RecG [Gammaproteobacteria bacterium]
MRSKETPQENLDTLPITTLKGVGPKVAARLERLGIHTIQDLLFHLPLRYQDRTRIAPIGSLRPGDQAVIVGEIGESQIKYGRRRSLLCHLSDGSGSLYLRFFHFSAAQQSILAKGNRLRCFGEVRQGPRTLEIVHPEYTLQDSQDMVQMEDHLTPIYPSTEGLHQISLRKLTEAALTLLDAHPAQELLPDEVMDRHHFPPLQEAIRLVHRPPPDTHTPELECGTHPTQQRLAFEELLAHHLSLRSLRTRVQRQGAPKIDGEGGFARRFKALLPFRLTGAQQRVSREISGDLSRSWPTHRLIQGDVGSGKTVVAALAALQALDCGYQAAIMAPTEILAEQHWQTFNAWLRPLGLDLVRLSGKLKASQRTSTLQQLAAPKPLFAVGTHALFQEDVKFAKLGLVIVDEQHRFGVHQRLALMKKGLGKGWHPHQLIMTATPIPRTLAMTAYADLDISIIDELPPGRTPVETVVVPDTRRDEVIQRIHAACREGRQAYWVCTLIDESETLQAQAASDTADTLTKTFRELKIGLVHGRMKAEEKRSAMDSFKHGRTDLLVATTVIEVGVDVPRASLMIIENAERLGLAQLHQLRGRIGRGSEKSTCVLLYHPPLSGQARDRLGVIRETDNGFRIAERDLELRGPGEVLGTRQTGMLQFRIADLARDHALFPAIETAAQHLIKHHPERCSSLVHRWLGNGVHYGGV